MNMEKIFVTQSSLPKFDEYIEEIKDIWNSHWLTNMGEKHQRLEELLRQYLDTDNIVLFTNGHLALEGIISALNITGEVITTPFTFASTTHAIVRNNLTPVFCDITIDDYTIDANKIESLITEKTSAIVPVHVYGHICNVNKIMDIAKKYNLKVIYDAAHTFGITINGVSPVNYGDASILSFHATKVYHTIEGGAVCFRDSSLKDILNSQKNFGITSADTVSFVGYNAKMNEFQAAMGICNLRHVNDDIAKRKELADIYYDLLENVRGIRVHRPANMVKSNYAYMPVLFDGYRYTRDQMLEKLKAENIFARKYFYPLTNHFQCYKMRFNYNATPIAEYVAARILTLPLYSSLQSDDIYKICKIILE